MKLTVNGEPMQVPEGLSVRGLLDHLAVTAARVAVEVNRQIVRRDQHAAHQLAEDDQVEIVTFVGGG